MKTAIVITTIFENKLFDELHANIRKFGHIDDTTVIVIPDKKTPKAVYDNCKALTKRGLKTLCPSLDEQERFLAKLGLYPAFVPYNTDNRRNVGYLMALEFAEIVISMDDDNFPTSKDFVGGHTAPFKKRTQYAVVSSSNRMYNPMTALEYDVESPKVLYPRGFPYRHRTEKHSYSAVKKNVEPSEIYLNAGLWLEDPDIDGITWVVQPARSKRPKKGFRDIVLAPDTWMPINTQNTSLRAEAIASYWFVRMNYPIAGMSIDRYGDIFSGYFVERCIKTLHKSIKVGTPLAVHKRNAHNYFKDIIGELACIIVLEELVDWLIDAKLEGSTFPDVYESLSSQMEDAVEREMKGFIWGHEVKAYFHLLGYLMRKWAETCRVIRG